MTTTVINKEQIIERLVSELVNMKKSLCPNCSDAYVYEGETELCPSGTAIHVRIDEAKKRFPALAAS